MRSIDGVGPSHSDVRGKDVGSRDDRVVQHFSIHLSCCLRGAQSLKRDFDCLDAVELKAVNS